MLRVSVSRGQAPCICPVCPEEWDSEGIATVGHDASERGSYAVLEAFECPQGHTQNHLTFVQGGVMLESAVEWLASAREALADMCSDQRIDRYR